MGVLELILAALITWGGVELYDATADVKGLHQATVIYQRGQQRAAEEAEKHKKAAILIGDLYKQEVTKVNEIIEDSSDPCRDLPADIGSSMVDGWRAIIAPPAGVLAE
jgi:hypothetical protein